MPSSAACPNRRRLDHFVQAHLELARAIAATDGPPTAARRLERWAEHLHGLIGVVAGDEPLPAHLQGLTVFDLAEARDALSAGASVHAQTICRSLTPAAPTAASAG